MFPLNCNKIFIYYFPSPVSNIFNVKYNGILFFWNKNISFIYNILLSKLLISTLFSSCVKKKRLSIVFSFLYYCTSTKTFTISRDLRGSHILAEFLKIFQIHENVPFPEGNGL